MNIVVVKRRKVGRVGADPKTADFIDGLTTYTIGSTFVGRQSYNPLINNPELEARLFKQLLNIEPREPDYKQKIKDYWSQMRIKITSSTGGKQLNITEDENGYFYSPEDYAMYVFAKHHPKVAPNEEACLMANIVDKMYYIDDPEDRKRKAKALFELENKSNLQFAKIKEKEDVVSELLFLYNVNSNLISDFEEKVLRLNDLRKANHEVFLSRVKDPNIKVRAFIKELLEYNIIRREGNSYFYLDMMMGDSEQSVIGFLKNEKFNAEVTAMEQKLIAEKQNKIVG